jgi:hypothetical protein
MNAIAGAVILAERFGASAGTKPAAPAAAVAPAALPVFHWVGIEPHESSPQVDDDREAHIGPRARLLQLRMRSIDGGRRPRSW